MSSLGLTPPAGRKVILVGDAGVGKTSIIYTAVDGVFQTHFPTLGSGRRAKCVAVDGQSVEMDIWDTAGQERFRAQIPLYARGAEAAIVVFDVSKRSTFDSIGTWVDTLREIMPPTAPLFLVGNKIDLTSEVPSYDAQAAACDFNAVNYFTTSAATKVGLEELFMAVGTAILESEGGLRVDRPEPPRRDDADGCC
jgi:small GTP-binding protein